MKKTINPEARSRVLDRLQVEPHPVDVLVHMALQLQLTSDVLGVFTGIYEGLSTLEKHEFIPEFLNAIPNGADMTDAGKNFIIRVALEDTKYGLAALYINDGPKLEMLIKAIALLRAAQPNQIALFKNTGRPTQDFLLDWILELEGKPQPGIEPMVAVIKHIYTYSSISNEIDAGSYLGKIAKTVIVAYTEKSVSMLDQEDQAPWAIHNETELYRMYRARFIRQLNRLQ